MEDVFHSSLGPTGEFEINRQMEAWTDGRTEGTNLREGGNGRTKGTEESDGGYG